MKKIDARSLKPEVQQQLRNQAIRLRSSGRTYKEIAEIVGVHLGTICKWCTICKREGAKGVRIKKRGRKLGSHRTMTDGQEKHIQKLIQDKVPNQLKRGLIVTAIMVAVTLRGGKPLLSCFVQSESISI